jgi:hypothetical protein
MGEDQRGPLLNALLDPVEAVLDLFAVDLGKPGEDCVELGLVLLEELRSRGGEGRLPSLKSASFQTSTQQWSGSAAGAAEGGTSSAFAEVASNAG